MPRDEGSGMRPRSRWFDLRVHTLSVVPALFLTFGPPHHVKRSAAAIDAAVLGEIDRQIDAAPPTDAAGVLRLALDSTASRLHFGLGHRTSLAFGAEREGNCIEYAHLFAALFERIRARVHVDAHAYVVHSDDARVLGERLSAPGYGDHDWCLVVVRGPPTRTGDTQLFVDPTLYDAGFGWDVRDSVTGDVRAP
jgi:hypothetical protein